MASPLELLSWAVSGLLISLGMAVGGMGHRSSLGFFSPFEHVQSWNPGMLVLFMAAMAPGFLLYWVVLPRLKQPVVSGKFDTTQKSVDTGLVVGSLVFGLGWALGGFCPGPSVVGMMSGSVDYVLFSYGLYFGITGQALLRRGLRDPTPNWVMTLLLGLIPSFFYFFPVLRVPADAHWPSWPLHLSVGGGLLIGIAAFLLMVTTGRVLGVSTIWRNILQPTSPSQRVSELVFFLGFMIGGWLAFHIAPQSYAAPPPPYGAPLLRVLGGICVAVGTDWANGCTSGHGGESFAFVCGSFLSSSSPP